MTEHNLPDLSWQNTIVQFRLFMTEHSFRFVMTEHYRSDLSWLNTIVQTCHDWTLVFRLTIAKQYRSDLPWPNSFVHTCRDWTITFRLVTAKYFPDMPWPNAHSNLPWQKMVAQTSDWRCSFVQTRDYWTPSLRPGHIIQTCHDWTLSLRPQNITQIIIPWLNTISQRPNDISFKHTLTEHHYLDHNPHSDMPWLKTISQRPWHIIQTYHDWTPLLSPQTSHRYAMIENHQSETMTYHLDIP